MLKSALQMWRTLVIGALTPLVAVAVSYWICITTGNWVATTVTMVALTAVGSAFGIRQALSDARKAGLPGRTPMTPERWKLVAFAIVNIIGSIAATFGVFAITQNRILEGLCALAVLPGGVVLFRRAYGLQPAPQLAQIGTWQLATLMQFLLGLIFIANLTTRLLWHHSSPNTRLMDDLLIAAYFTITPLLIANAIEIRAWYRRSMLTVQHEEKTTS